MLLTIRHPNLCCLTFESTKKKEVLKFLKENYIDGSSLQMNVTPSTLFKLDDIIKYLESGD